MLAPRDEAELAEALATRRQPVEVVAGGTKRVVGRPVEAEALDVSDLTGLVDYAPSEMVVTVRAATPVAELEAMLARERQRLAFEPPDLRTLLGTEGVPTIGGVLAANLSGSRRVCAGAARDHFLGFRAVDGLGVAFKAGGRVVKNVTGYDLPKLLAGSWGTLAVLTEVSLRVVPAAEHEVTLAVPAASAASAVGLLVAALGSAHEVSAGAWEGRRRVLLRLEGFEASVVARLAALRDELRSHGEGEEVIEAQASRELWRRVGCAEVLARWPVVWRVSLPATDMPALIEAARPADCLLDWGGGLAWLAFDAVTDVRPLLRGGHATLFKAPLEARRSLPVFPPPGDHGREAIARLRQALDPHGLLNPGRMD